MGPFLPGTAAYVCGLPIASTRLGLVVRVLLSLHGGTFTFNRSSRLGHWAPVHLQVHEEGPPRTKAVKYSLLRCGVRLLTLLFVGGGFLLSRLRSHGTRWFLSRLACCLGRGPLLSFSTGFSPSGCSASRRPAPPEAAALPAAGVPGPTPRVTRKART